MRRPIKGTSLLLSLYIFLIPHILAVLTRELHFHGQWVHLHLPLLLAQAAKVSEMARAVGALASVVLALACLVATAAARESPFGEAKTYAPPYGTSPTPSGGSPVVPTPSGGSPVVPTPDVPYSPTPSGASPVVPTPTVPYTPTPYTPSDPAPATPTPSSPGTCSWWSSNTSSFPNIISIFTTLIDLFSTITGGTGGSGGSGGSGITSIISSIFGNQMTVYQGLTNTRTDGYGALARQSSAAMLNAYTRPREFAYSPFQVKLQFSNALGSQQSAFQMARVFENANIALGARH